MAECAFQYRQTVITSCRGIPKSKLSWFYNGSDCFGISIQVGFQTEGMTVLPVVVGTSSSANYTWRYGYDARASLWINIPTILRR